MPSELERAVAFEERLRERCAERVVPFRFGVALFNEVWRLIESREDDDRMLHMAHASRYAWGEAPECRPENIARGEWLASRASRLRYAPVLFPVACLLTGVPKVFEPLHGHRTGFREIGLWLG